MSEDATKRLFVAVFPPADIAASLRTAVGRLAQTVPPRAVRWTRPEQIHLTLQFLGAVAVARIPEIGSALQAACRGHRQHQLRVEGFGCFPNQNRPQIIWAGLAGDLGPLESLQKSVNAGLLAVGCVGEDRPFHPHLTIGRARDLNATGRKAVAEALAREQNREIGQWQVGSIDLMQSVLSPQGATYDTLQSIPLEI
ncbi:MAG: RNA 2',3'-cyclic phosphodiesterase [Limisphaerales bacterium]